MVGMPQSVRVMTLNVCGKPASGPTFPSLATRAAHFCRQIEDSDVDVLTLQELWSRAHLETVRPLLPSFRHVAWHRGVGGRPAGGLVVFARRPLRPRAYRSYWGTLPGRGELSFRLRRGMSATGQGVLIVELVGTGALLATTHLTANHDGDWSVDNRYHTFQRAQLRRLHAQLSRLPAVPTILTGDFNVASESPLYPTIVQHGRWYDPFAATDPRTFQVEFLPAGAPAHRIDYLLVRGGVRVVESSTVLADPVPTEDGKIFLSDHIGLTARITL